MTTTITSHAQRAVTCLIEQCHLFEFQDDCAEGIVQAAIDAAVREAREKMKEEEKKADGL